MSDQSSSSTNASTLAADDDHWKRLTTDQRRSGPPQPSAPTQPDEYLNPTGIAPMQDQGYSAAALTRRHFCLIAQIIAALPHDREAIAHEFAAKLGESNPRFDRERFLAACGVRS